MVSTSACGRPLKSAASYTGATHEGSTDLDAGAIWCRAPEKGGPFMRQGWAVVRKISSGNQVRVGHYGATSRTCSSSSLTLLSVRAGSLGETHTYVKPEASCVPVCQCLHNTNTADSGRTRGKQTSLPELSRINSRSAESSGWNRHSPGNVSCH